mgnify:CR=1 FL=1
MEQRRGAWIYCAIDAPEDRNGALKSQFKQLIDYGEQMGFELVGSSSDVGTTPLWNRNGFRHFIEAVQREQVDVLLIVAGCPDHPCSSQDFRSFRKAMMSMHIRHWKGKLSLAVEKIGEKIL